MLTRSSERIYNPSRYTSRNNNTNVHCVMLNLSKTFDGINISTLINKIKLSGLPSIFVNTV